MTLISISIEIKLLQIIQLMSNYLLRDHNVVNLQLTIIIFNINSKLQIYGLKISKTSLQSQKIMKFNQKHQLNG